VRDIHVTRWYCFFFQKTRENASLECRRLHLCIVCNIQVMHSRALKKQDQCIT
jgi:hypothetical protein